MCCLDFVVGGAYVAAAPGCDCAGRHEHAGYEEDCVWHLVSLLCFDAADYQGSFVVPGGVAAGAERYHVGYLF